MRADLLHRLRRDEHGVTLLELVITIVIVGMILGALTLSVIMSFESTVSSERRVDRSNLAEFAARYFTADAVSSAPTQTGGSAPCGTDPVVLIQNDGTTVSYAVTSTGGRATLDRRVCDASGVLADRSVSLGSSAVAFTATGGCPGAGAACTLTVAWPDGDDGGFTLRGTPRTLS